MSARSSFLVPSVFVLTLVAAGCGGEPGEGPSRDAAASAQVTYEPAYPAEVSEEGLSEEDVAQQQVEHRHDGGEAHSHEQGEEPGDGSHTHGEGETDDHDH